MKRTPLIRRTGLRRTGPIRRRPQQDPVQPDEHRHVLERDRMCIAFRFDHTHECRNQWGDPHAPTDLSKMTVDHVWRIAGGVKGKRAPSDRHHMVAACYAINVGVPSEKLREFERDWLATLEQQGRI